MLLLCLTIISFGGQGIRMAVFRIFSYTVVVYHGSFSTVELPIVSSESHLSKVIKMGVLFPGSAVLLMCVWVCFVLCF